MREQPNCDIITYHVCSQPNSAVLVGIAWYTLLFHWQPLADFCTISFSHTCASIKALISLVFHPLPAMLLLLGGPLITRYHPCLIVKPLWCALKHLSAWFGLVADWCTLDEASLGVEATNLPLHQFAFAHYLAGAQGPIAGDYSVWVRLIWLTSLTDPPLCKTLRSPIPGQLWELA